MAITFRTPISTSESSWRHFLFFICYLPSPFSLLGEELGKRGLSERHKPSAQPSPILIYGPPPETKTRLNRLL